MLSLFLRLFLQSAFLKNTHHLKVIEIVSTKHVIVSWYCKVLNVVALVNLYSLNKVCSSFSNMQVKNLSRFSQLRIKISNLSTKKKHDLNESLRLDLSGGGGAIGHFRVTLFLCFKTRLRAKNEFHLQVHCHAKQTRFHLHGIARRLVLKQRQMVIRKWPIRQVPLSW